ncbi:ANTAR domain-containing response regulator [Tepidamorphus sp. 3E244]|uniref:ANTAR domain-containing response regulator n=1 Tax=Tepidamorphus sp. 3E244 TaxID=3385498 RepID=UPI0038FD38C3
MRDQGNVRLKPGAEYRALLIDAQGDRARLFASIMSDRGYAVAQTVASVDEAILMLGSANAAKQATAIDLLVLYTNSMNGKDIEAIGKLAGAADKPILVVTESGDPDVIARAVSAGATFCQPLGVNADRVHAGVVGAISLHKRISALEAEREDAVRALTERKLIDRAKQIVMASRDLNEADAFAHLQKLSMTRNTPMADIARSIIEAKELLG